MPEAQLSTDLVWKEVGKHLFAVLSYVNPKGQARSAGMVYAVKNRRVYMNTLGTSWKAKHIRRNPNVALNVTIPKRIPVLPWIKIPQATIAFSGEATVVDAADADREVVSALIRAGAKVVAGMSIIEVEPTGHFMTYGVGVPLLDMRDPEKARSRVPVG